MLRFSQLQCKEVICIGDGRRLGYVSDVCLDLPQGQVQAILVPGPCRFLGLFGRSEDYRIPWHCIRRIGPEIVLVDVKAEECRIPRGKPGWLFGD